MRLVHAGHVLRTVLLARAPHMIRDRKFHLRTYRRCMVGTEMVDWLLQQSALVHCRTQAVGMWQALVEEGVVVHGKHKFIMSQSPFPCIVWHCMSYCPFPCPELRVKVVLSGLQLWPLSDLDPVIPDASQQEHGVPQTHLCCQWNYTMTIQLSMLKTSENPLYLVISHNKKFDCKRITLVYWYPCARF